jgi:hypothetical protein
MLAAWVSLTKPTKTGNKKSIKKKKQWPMDNQYEVGGFSSAYNIIKPTDLVIINKNIITKKKSTF